MSRVSILLSTYNGEKYLNQQLDSLFSQTYKDFDIIVRDDGSSDKTLEILKSYDIKLLFSDGNIGIKKSFETLLIYAYENSNADYFMFCDQDDVWNNDKIEKTLEQMQELENFYENNLPLLVHTDLEVVDENLKTISISMWEYQKINPKLNSLNRLLVQNTITGCTMMINRSLAKKSLPIPENCIMHDWWIGLVAVTFGKISYLGMPTIKYRQHNSNIIGAKGFDIDFIIRSIPKKISLFENIIQAKLFLKQFEDKLDVKIVIMLKEFTILEKKNWWQKRLTLWKYKFFKQGFIKNIGLFFKINNKHTH